MVGIGAPRVALCLVATSLHAVGAVAMNTETISLPHYVCPTHGNIFEAKTLVYRNAQNMKQVYCIPCIVEYVIAPKIDPLPALVTST